MKTTIPMTVAGLLAVAALTGCMRKDAPAPEAPPPAAAATPAGPPAEIVIPGERLITESLTSTADGTVIVGSMLGQTIFRAAPGEATASAWIQPGTDGLTGVFGVFADEASGTLYACSGNP